MASLKKAIEEKCKDCTYDSAAPGTWREQVEACNVRSCALWEVRPVTVDTVNKRRAGIIVDTSTDRAALLAQLPDDEEAEA